jgi:hypothetical protein
MWLFPIPRRIVCCLAIASSWWIPAAPAVAGDNLQSASASGAAAVPSASAPSLSVDQQPVRPEVGESSSKIDDDAAIWPRNSRYWKTRAMNHAANQPGQENKQHIRAGAAGEVLSKHEECVGVDAQTQSLFDASGGYQFKFPASIYDLQSSKKSSSPMNQVPASFQPDWSQRKVIFSGRGASFAPVQSNFLQFANSVKR